MAADTVTAQEILMKMAQDCGAIRSAFITSVVTANTVYKLTGVSLGPRETFKYALATWDGGGIRQITAHQIASENITIASAFTTNPAAGDRIRIAWWDPDKRDAAMAAIREAIRQSWGVFGRETIGSLSITLSANDAEYTLPATVEELWRVGILNSTGDYDWRAERDLWRMGGEAGAYFIQFLNNKNTFLPSSWDGETLYGWYLDKEPDISAETDTTRLPLDYFNLASYLYLVKQGAPQPGANEDARVVLQNYQSKLAQLKMDADAARLRLSKGRPKRPGNVRYEWGR